MCYSGRGPGLLGYCWWKSSIACNPLTDSAGSHVGSSYPVHLIRYCSRCRNNEESNTSVTSHSSFLSTSTGGAWGIICPGTSAKILPYFPPYFPPVNFCAFRCTSYALGTTSIYRCIVLAREINFPPESSRDLEGSRCNSGAYHFSIYLVQNTWPILNCLHFHYIASSHSWTK